MFDFNLRPLRKIIARANALGLSDTALADSLTIIARHHPNLDYNTLPYLLGVYARAPARFYEDLPEYARLLQLRHVLGALKADPARPHHIGIKLKDVSDKAALAAAMRPHAAKLLMRLEQLAGQENLPPGLTHQRVQELKLATAELLPQGEVPDPESLGVPVKWRSDNDRAKLYECSKTWHAYAVGVGTSWCTRVMGDSAAARLLEDDNLWALWVDGQPIWQHHGQSQQLKDIYDRQIAASKALAAVPDKTKRQQLWAALYAAIMANAAARDKPPAFGTFTPCLTSAQARVCLEQINSGIGEEDVDYANAQQVIRIMLAHKIVADKYPDLCVKALDCSGALGKLIEECGAEVAGQLMKYLWRLQKSNDDGDWQILQSLVFHHGVIDRLLDGDQENGIKKWLEVLAKQREPKNMIFFQQLFSDPKLISNLLVSRFETWHWAKDFCKSDEPEIDPIAKPIIRHYKDVFSLEQKPLVLNPEMFLESLDLTDVRDYRLLDYIYRLNPNMMQNFAPLLAAAAPLHPPLPSRPSKDASNDAPVAVVPAEVQPK